MATDTSESLPRESELDELIAVYLAAVDAGLAPDPNQFIAEHPEFSGELGAFLDSQREVESWAAPLRPIAQVALTTLLAAEVTIGAASSTAGAKTGVTFGDYELLEVIGRGGMGVVYKARQRHPRRLVAIKMIRLSPALDEREVARFRNEAEIAARLAHPNIVPIYEVGEHAGHLFFSMRLLEGGNLAEQIDALQSDPRRAAQYLLTIARAVHHAHQHGILHRDLKPSNVLLDGEQPVVTDFGSSKQLDAETTFTNPGSIIGTPAYMAPELAGGDGHLVTTAGDVYGLGAILYAMLTGRPPFRAATVLDTLEMVRRDAPQAPRRLNARVDRDLECICLKALEKDPGRRYGSAGAMADDLERWLAGQPIQARPMSRAEWFRSWCRRNPAVAGLGGLAALLLAVVLVGLATGISILARERARALDHQRSAEQQEALAVARATELRDHLYVANIKLAQAAWRIGNIPRAVELLAQDRPSEGAQPDRRGFEWHYLWRLCNPQSKVLLGHQGEVYAAAFSPDGSALVSGGQDGQLVVWDVSGETQITAWRAHEDCVNTISFAADGRTLVTASCDATIKIWDATTWKSVPISTWQAGARAGAGISPDGTRVASWSEEEVVRVWDVRSGQLLGTLSPESGTIMSAAFSPDGKRLVTASWRDGGGILWDLERMERVATLRDPSFNVSYSVAFSHNGLRIAVGTWEGTVRLYEPPGETAIDTFRVLPARIASLGFSRDDRMFAAAGHDSTVRLWDLHSATQRTVLAGHVDPVWRAVFSPTASLVATAGSDGTVRLWEPATVEAWLPLHCLTPVVLSIACSDDGRLLVAGTSREAVATRVWDPASGAVVCEHPGTSSIALSRNLATVAAAYSDRSIRLFDAANTSSRLVIADLSDGVSRLVLSRDNAKLAGLMNGRVYVWDARTGQLTTTLSDFAANDVTLGFSVDGAWLVTATNEVKLWHTGTGRLHKSLGAHDSRVESVAFSADGAVLATGAMNGSVKLWELATGSERATALGHVSGAYSLAFSPDGKTLASGGADTTIRLWRVADGQDLLTLEAHTGLVRAVAFSPEGNLISAADSRDGPGEIFLWRADPLTSEKTASSR